MTTAPDGPEALEFARLDPSGGAATRRPPWVAVAACIIAGSCAGAGFGGAISFSVTATVASVVAFLVALRFYLSDLPIEAIVSGVIYALVAGFALLVVAALIGR